VNGVQPEEQECVRFAEDVTVVSGRNQAMWILYIGQRFSQMRYFFHIQREGR
jgi:hypothetical protein